ncbi:MAG: (d)CMP kinase [Bryobacteraceae bacterium]
MIGESGIVTRNTKRWVVAIDGPAGAGKSTIARAVATRLGFAYIDTGAMYRAVGLWAVRAGIDLNDPLKLDQLAHQAVIDFLPEDSRVLLNGEDVTNAIREPGISDAASKVAAIPGVRRAMRDEQRRIGSQQSVVMEGRDIGTVVFPDADVKVYLDADPTIRAARRAAELSADAGAIAKEMAERDSRDRTRVEAPLVQAPDAEYLDSTRLTPLEVQEEILKLVRKRTSN